MLGLTAGSRPPLPGTATLPPDFLGLGYEMSSPARMGLLSTDNTRYVQLLSHLGRGGVMRFGGIVADFTRYQPDGPPATEPKHTVITRAALEQLRGFLDKTGWNAIWSVNFGQGTLKEAIAEARDVAQILGERLLFLELGNEVENYGQGAHPLREKSYSFHQYRAEYARWHAALLAAVPNLRFAAPDTAASVEWLEAMAADAQGTVQLLTTHYYRNAQQHGSAEQLAKPDPALHLKLQRLRTVSELNHIPWRMCETNSFSGGGLPGVSDTLLGALWTLDFLLLLASEGCAGVNLETGVNQLGFVSSYSPIQDDGKGNNWAGAPYYGMLAFARAARGATEISALALPAATPEFTGYVFRKGKAAVAHVYVNRSAQQTLSVPASAMAGQGAGQVVWLQGKGLLSGEGITLGGTGVDASGLYRADQGEALSGTTLDVAPGSAALWLAASEGA